MFPDDVVACAGTSAVTVAVGSSDMSSSANMSVIDAIDDRVPGVRDLNILERRKTPTPRG